MVSFKVTAIATQLLAPPRNATPKRAILETRFQWRNRSFSLPNYCASAPHVPICLALLRLTGEEGSELLEAQPRHILPVLQAQCPSGAKQQQIDITSTD